MEYQAFDPNVEIIGAAVKSFMNSLVGGDVISILKKYEIYPLEEDKWYNQQTVLNVYKKVAEKNYMNLVAIGMKIPDQAVWPPDLTDIHAALTSIGVAYSMNHRGGEIGEYLYEKTGECSGVMVCRNPYPSDFDYGLIYRVIQKFRGATSNTLLVKLDDSKPTRKNGADSCTYQLSW